MTREEAIKYAVEWLKDEYLDAKDEAFIKIALEALEQEPCEDAISRQAVLDLAKKRILVSEYEYKVVCHLIDKLPSVNPQPKTSWIPINERLPDGEFVKTLVSCEDSDGLPVTPMVAIYSGIEKE